MWIGVTRPYPPVCNDILTPRNLFLFGFLKMELTFECLSPWIILIIYTTGNIFESEPKHELEHERPTGIF